MPWRVFGMLLLIAPVVIFGISLVEPMSSGSLSARPQLGAPPIDTSGFARAIAPWDWQFPRDHSAHPDFQTEWWYFTGNLADESSGRRFGFQFTIFRRALSPDFASSSSEFRSNQIYFAHFTVSDIAGGDFHHDVRYGRGGAGLAGAEDQPRWRVWVEGWSMRAENDAATAIRIQAASDDFAIDLALRQVKPPALQGKKGLSPKSAEVGNASYYYSLSRLETVGQISLGGARFAVSGHSWMDHEFSTSALGADAQGWDWFGLLFDDDSELMVGQIRLTDGGLEPAFGGLIINPDGSTRQLDSSEISIRGLDTWRSPHSLAEYPAGWDIAVAGEAGFRITVAPLLADQELHDGGIIYWEGAVSISGDKTGYGYAELTGYAESMQNRF
ncbi:MAG: carotenoid 1,2-hydratase [Chloroflexi bacterium]|nr:carotenoid 1,2-hydratase [Chloroflexota bacterium]MCY3582201.1 carotenoid 1,2-hydratase [Chloroflexota bacterium]MCY3715853.1 carotenoid 1,2-hydratase [Chloroflexota bacterium]MDE2649913.1 carotenoid 1,2-hydratase [Chloroflexota bacterium]MXX82330.1 carotenoid 1,2-hydratase [Chloroflexota bacterium]